MAFRCMEPPRHIHVPIFDPQREDDEMLLVNFTTCATPALTTHASCTPRTTRNSLMPPPWPTPAQSRERNQPSPKLSPPATLSSSKICPPRLGLASSKVPVTPPNFLPSGKSSCRRHERTPSLHSRKQARPPHPASRPAVRGKIPLLEQLRDRALRLHIAAPAACGTQWRESVPCIPSPSDYESILARLL